MGPFSQFAFSKKLLFPDEYASADANGRLERTRTDHLAHTVRDIKDVVRLQLQVRRLVLHDFFHICRDLFPLWTAIRA